MSDSRVTDFVDRFESVMNGRTPAASAGLFAADFVDHAPWPGHSPDADGFAAGLADMVAAFPDFRVETLRTVEQGDMLSTHFAISGSHLGPFMGAPGSGKTFRVEAIDILRLRDGRIAEHWGVIDTAAMAEQLGL